MTKMLGNKKKALSTQLSDLKFPYPQVGKYQFCIQIYMFFHMQQIWGPFFLYNNFIDDSKLSRCSAAKLK